MQIGGGASGAGRTAVWRPWLSGWGPHGPGAGAAVPFHLRRTCEDSPVRPEAGVRSVSRDTHSAQDREQALLAWVPCTCTDGLARTWRAVNARPHPPQHPRLAAWLPAPWPHPLALSTCTTHSRRSNPLPETRPLSVPGVGTAQWHPHPSPPERAGGKCDRTWPFLGFAGTPGVLRRPSPSKCQD